MPLLTAPLREFVSRAGFLPFRIALVALAWLIAGLPVGIGHSAWGQTGPVASAPANGGAGGFRAEWLKPLNWRSIGPASMGGRIVDLEVVESNPFTFYIATASGGLFKTTNNGTTFTPLFDREATVSIGDIALCRGDSNVLWLGTGEHNARNSVSWGNGVYRSVDAGKTWQHKGLDKSFQIGRIAVHHHNPDVAYVGALGRLWGPSEERGLYKTTDGGNTWKRILFIDNQTGCIEVQMHPTDPDTLYVAMYERQRDIYSVGDPAKRWGKGSGLYKTTDGGNTWSKLTNGLPTGQLGRIGIAIYAEKPDTLFAIVESEKIGEGPATPGAFLGVANSQDGKSTALPAVLAGGPAEKAGLKAGDVILEIDGKKVASYNDVVLAIRRHKPGEKSPFVVRRGDETLTLDVTWGTRGGTDAKPFLSYLGGQRANADKEQGPNGFQTGGVFKSTDAGATWKRINSLNPRPFYYSQVRVDPRDEKYLYVMGIAFHYSTDGGKTFQTGAEAVHADHHALWVDPRDGRHLILGCDGGLYISHDRGKTFDFHNILAISQFYDVGIDTRSPYWVYGGLQDNGSWGAPSRKRGLTGPANHDWLRIGSGDGFLCRPDPNNPDIVYYESQYGRMARVNVKTGERVAIAPKAEAGKSYRFNWKTPFTLAPSNSKHFYAAGNYVFRSTDQGKELTRISPEITATNRGSATALAISPLDANVMYVGTDDGFLWVTKDGGANWRNVSERLPGRFTVATIETSKHQAGRAYIALDAHRSDDDKPYPLVTEDFGETFTSLTANLPIGSTYCLREDPKNADLLYCGTEFAIWTSLDRGTHWLKLSNNLPTVAVHEVAVHPTVNEIVAATHGRGLWILDITPLRQYGEKRPQIVAGVEPVLFPPGEGVLWTGALTVNQSGNRRFVGENPSYGVPIDYVLPQTTKTISLRVETPDGKLVRQLKADGTAGLHRVMWDLRSTATPAPAVKAAPPTGTPAASNTPSTTKPTDNKPGETPAPTATVPAPGTIPARGATPGTPLGRPVAPGEYVVRLMVDAKVQTAPLRIHPDPEFPHALLTEELDQFEQKGRPIMIE